MGTHEIRTGDLNGCKNVKGVRCAPQNSYSQGFYFFESAAAGSAFQGESPPATFRPLSVDIRQ